MNSKRRARSSFPLATICSGFAKNRADPQTLADSALFRLQPTLPIRSRSQISLQRACTACPLRAQDRFPIAPRRIERLANGGMLAIDTNLIVRYLTMPARLPWHASQRSPASDCGDWTMRKVRFGRTESKKPSWRVAVPARQARPHQRCRLAGDSTRSSPRVRR